MICFEHEGIAAVGVCASCQKGLCRSCCTTVHGKLSCRGACEESLDAIEKMMRRSRKGLDRNDDMLAKVDGMKARAASTVGLDYYAFGFLVAAGACFLDIRHRGGRRPDERARVVVPGSRNRRPDSGLQAQGQALLEG